MAAEFISDQLNALKAIRKNLDKVIAVRGELYASKPVKWLKSDAGLNYFLKTEHVKYACASVVVAIEQIEQFQNPAENERK